MCSVPGQGGVSVNYFVVSGQLDSRKQFTADLAASHF